MRIDTGEGWKEIETGSKWNKRKEKEEEEEEGVILRRREGEGRGLFPPGVGNPKIKMKQHQDARTEMYS